MDYYDEQRRAEQNRQRMLDEQRRANQMADEQRRANQKMVDDQRCANQKMVDNKRQIYQEMVDDRRYADQMYQKTVDDQRCADQSLSLYDVLIGKRWQALSGALDTLGGSWDITFMRNGEFNSLIKGYGYFTVKQQVNGKWHIIESRLFLDFIMFMKGIPKPMPSEFKIQFTQISNSKLLGMDTFDRIWELERIEPQANFIR